MIIIVNKWDLVISGKERTGRPTKSSRMQENKRPADRAAYEQRLRDALKFLAYAPIIVRLRLNRKRHRENIPDIGKSCHRAPPAHRNRRDEPLLKHVDFERASVPAASRCGSTI